MSDDSNPETFRTFLSETMNFQITNAQRSGLCSFGSSRERIAAINAANVQYAGQQRVLSGRRAVF